MKLTLEEWYENELDLTDDDLSLLVHYEQVLTIKICGDFIYIAKTRDIDKPGVWYAENWILENARLEL